MKPERRVLVGEVTGAFGVAGWIRLRSYTDPAEGILLYPRWLIGDRAWQLAEGRRQGASVVARLEGLSDRDAAAAMRGAPVELERGELPPPEDGRYYWADLAGCEVASTGGAALGTVASVFSTGAQDVMVVRGERQRLIPFVSGPIVRSVDLGARRIVVDWEPDY